MQNAKMELRRVSARERVDEFHKMESVNFELTLSLTVPTWLADWLAGWLAG